MRIAVAADGEMITRQFQDSRWFRLYEAEGGQITKELTVPAFGEDQEGLVRSLAEYRANILICGGLSGRARAALGEAGILTFGGIIGEADIAVSSLLNGNLSSGADAACTAEACSGSCGEESCRNCQFKN